MKHTVTSHGNKLLTTIFCKGVYIFFQIEYITNDAKHAVVNPPCAHIIAIIHQCL